MYKPLMSVFGVAVMLLGVLILIAPRLYLSPYVPNYTPELAFAAQRLSPAVLGLGAIMWAARGLRAGRIASTLSMIGALVWLGVAATGLFHYFTGMATSQILIAAVSELIFALLFYLASRQMRIE